MPETVRRAQAGQVPTLFLMVGLPASGKTRTASYRLAHARQQQNAKKTERTAR